MSVQQSYNEWATQYDTNINKTRDLEAIALREKLAPVNFKDCLEIGCGTGKNSVWLVTKTNHLTAVDLSEEMLAKAKEKLSGQAARFVQFDITKPWTFREQQYDLVTFSLVLEHIEQLEPVMKEVAAALRAGGHLYIGELHPFKQYAGSKARFETESGEQVVECYTHHLSDFIHAASSNGMKLVNMDEYFDNDERSVPRIMTMLWIKE